MRLSRVPLWLTFDDGPSPQTSLLLHSLEQENIRAIFFCQGAHLEAFPDAGTAIVAKGHLLGNHSWNHVPFHKLSITQAKDEIQSTEDQIDKAYFRAGVARQYRVFRFPYGAQGFGASWLGASFRWASPHYWHLQSLLSNFGFVGPKSICPNLAPLRFPYSLFQNGHDWLWNYHTSDWTWNDQYPDTINNDTSSLISRTTKSSRSPIILLHDHDSAPNGRTRIIHQLAQCAQFQTFWCPP